MKTVARQSLFNTLFSYLGIIIGAFNVMVLYTTYLSDTQRGVIDLLNNLSMIYMITALLGNNNVIIRYLPLLKTKDNRHSGLFSWTLLSSIGLFIVFTLIFIAIKQDFLSLFEEDRHIVEEYYYWIVVMAAAQIAFVLLEAVSVPLMRTVEPLFFREVFLRLCTTLWVILIAAQIISFTHFIYLYVVSHMLIVLLQAYVVFIQLKFRFRIRLSELMLPIRKDLFSYGLFTFLSVASVLLIYRIDSLMVGSLISLEHEGVYFVYVSIAAVILVPYKAMGRAVLPMINEFWKNNEMDKMNAMFKKNSLLNTIICGWVFVGILINVDNLAWFFADKPLFIELLPLVFWLGLTQFANSLFGVNGLILFTSKHYRYDFAFNALLVVLGISLNVLFIREYGAVGAAIASIISMTLVNIGRSLLIWKYYRLQPFTFRHPLVIAMLAILAYGFYFFRFTHNAYLDIAIRSSLFSGCFFLFIYLTGFSPDLNYRVNKLLKK